MTTKALTISSRDSDYPTWVCYSCGISSINPQSELSIIATWHVGTCGVCNQKASVTEPRDFGYPSFIRIETK